MSEPATTHDPYALWRDASYRNYAASWFLITFSRRVEFAGIGLFMATTYAAREAALNMAIMALVQAIPVILLWIPAGQIADRFNRHRVMALWFSLGVVSAAGILATVLLHGATPVENSAIAWIYLMLVIANIGWALGGPSRQAMLAQMIPAELFSTGVAWNSSVFYTANVAGPLVGSGLIAAFSYLGSWTSMAPLFGLVLFCRVLSMAAILRIRYRPTSHAEPSLTWENVLAGIRFVWATKMILATITLDLFAVLLGGVTYLMPIYALQILHAGPVGFGILQAADMMGAICMAIVLAHRPPLRRAGVTLLWAVAGFGVATIVFGASQWFWLSLLMMFLIGALDNISVVVRHTLIQMQTPDEMRGRVSAVNGVFITSSNELGGLESGLTAWLFGPVISVVAGGVGTILVVLGAMWVWPQLLKIGSLASIRPAAIEEPDRDV
jgi:MFS family permease